MKHDFKELKLDRVTRQFAGAGGKAFNALDELTLTVKRGEFICLLGPSGCGKSTALNCIAGLMQLSGGSIWLDEQRIDTLPPEKRGFGMVFQNYALFPHMTVAKNIGFGLKMRGVSPSAMTPRVAHALKLVQLTGQEHKLPGQLSGGQQQRVAIARAIVIEPPLILMDEPLSNLDAKLRQRMRIELRELQRRLGITTVYVTHDQAEALFLSHRVAVMQSGRIVQEGRPRELYASPASPFVADFVGDATFVPGEVVDGGVRALGGVVRCALSEALVPGAKALLVLRPERLLVHAGATGGPNEFAGTLRVAAFLGDHLDCVVEIGDTVMRARAHPAAELRRDQKVWVELPPDHCLAIPDDGWRPRALTRTFEQDTE